MASYPPPVSLTVKYGFDLESPQASPGPGSQQRQRSLLSDLLREASVEDAAWGSSSSGNDGAGSSAGGGGRGARGGGDEAAAAAIHSLLMGKFDGAAAFDDDDDDDDEAELAPDELSLLADLDAAWSSPSSSVLSRASSSRPITIPASTYFKDTAQRVQLDRLNKKRQWYSQQQEQDRLLGKTGSKVAAHQAARHQQKHKPGRQPRF
ncbi:hypothetical protein Rsub_06751 [Raphidocelis subcapitata]|uniref:Uncharacterized protein n=1 Tax=Raphidocelis subcapitata TaxID=307507 RepID=A0A2V0P1A4_9CHLO|nr:hypothetical protein Rsub_06751 [Raphidocelis subcapitata]|eukprot:GBF93648.1 hypothetical protein Rsub_06751 [Raphidocelis subcapitata]